MKNYMSVGIFNQCITFDEAMYIIFLDTMLLHIY